MTLYRSQEIEVIFKEVKKTFITATHQRYYQKNYYYKLVTLWFCTAAKYNKCHPMTMIDSRVVVDVVKEYLWNLLPQTFGGPISYKLDRGESKKELEVRHTHVWTVTCMLTVFL